MKLKDRVAIITGAGRGIGRAIALAYAHEGADIVAVSRTISEVEETASLVRALGRYALALKVNVSRTEDVKSMVEKVLQGFSKIDILVNDAGIIGPIGPLIENDIRLWTETINVNLIGTFICCRTVLPYMVKRRTGKIINLSGGGATSSRPRFSAYATSKAAVVRLTETLADEVRDYDIQVNAIAPGTIKTKMLEQIVAAQRAAGDKELTNAREITEDKGDYLERVTNLAIFLACEDSKGLTGRLISAVWDDWRGLNEEKIRVIMNKGFYTLRRIDGYFFAPKNRDIPKR